MERIPPSKKIRKELEQVLERGIEGRSVLERWRKIIMDEIELKQIDALRKELGLNASVEQPAKQRAKEV